MTKILILAILLICAVNCARKEVVVTYYTAYDEETGRLYLKEEEADE